LTAIERARNVDLVATASFSGSWARLHRLQASFAGAARTRAEERSLLADARALGATAVPACLRALRGPLASRPWVVSVLRAVAEAAPERVRTGLRELTDGVAADDVKLSALSLLAELGDETATARFADPVEVHRRSLARFAAQLGTPADVASAAELLVSRLSPGALVEFVEAFAEACPDGARRLGEELCARVELDVQARVEVDRLLAPLRQAELPATRPRGRPALLVGLRHDDGRAVIAIARRVLGARRWRSLCVLIDAGGVLADVLYRDDGTLAELRDSVIDPIAADGYQPLAVTASSARRLVAVAARRAVSLGRPLPLGYYLGRDLLELADSHLQGERSADTAALLGRALELLAGGERLRARPLLEHVVGRRPDDAEAVSALGLCALGQGELDAALPMLARAAELEPAWPLHHWNLAAAAHRAGRLDVCAHALVEFLAHADEPAAATVDTGHHRRVAIARRFVADHRRLQTMSGDGREPRA
jgi:hypothetical protein